MSAAIQTGVCSHCSPYLVECDHVCPTCGKEVELDNCDGDMVDGRMVGYEGSTHGFKCEGCCVWTHTDCGDAKAEVCKPCLSVPA